MNIYFFLSSITDILFIMQLFPASNAQRSVSEDIFITVSNEFFVCLCSDYLKIMCGFYMTNLKWKTRVTFFVTCKAGHTAN